MDATRSASAAHLSGSTAPNNNNNNNNLPYLFLRTLDGKSFRININNNPTGLEISRAFANSYNSDSDVHIHPSWVKPIFKGQLIPKNQHTPFREFQSVACLHAILVKDVECNIQFDGTQQAANAENNQRTEHFGAGIRTTVGDFKARIATHYGVRQDSIQIFNSDNQDIALQNNTRLADIGGGTARFTVKGIPASQANRGTNLPINFMYNFGGATIFRNLNISSNITRAALIEALSNEIGCEPRWIASFWGANPDNAQETFTVIHSAQENNGGQQSKNPFTHLINNNASLHALRNSMFVLGLEKVEVPLKLYEQFADNSAHESETSISIRGSRTYAQLKKLIADHINQRRAENNQPQITPRHISIVPTNSTLRLREPQANSQRLLPQNRDIRGKAVHTIVSDSSDGSLNVFVSSVPTEAPDNLVRTALAIPQHNEAPNHAGDPIPVAQIAPPIVLELPQLIGQNYEQNLGQPVGQLNEQPVAQPNNPQHAMPLQRNNANNADGGDNNNAENNEAGNGNDNAENNGQNSCYDNLPNCVIS